jgi:integrase/recombinase XerD
MVLCFYVYKSSYNRIPRVEGKLRPLCSKLGVMTIPVEKITQVQISRFLELHSRKYKPRTIVFYANILKDFFGYFQKKTQVNTKLIRRPKFTTEPPNFLTEDEFEQMEECLDDYEYHDLQKKCALRLLWRTGMRVSELCDLNLGDIHNDKNFCQIITKKNKRYRWILWSGEDHQLLMRYIGVKLCQDEYEALFTSNSNNCKGRVTTRSMERWINEIAERAGLDRHVHPHMFRHGKAHFMLKNKANLNEIQEVLGHRNIVSTQMYARLLPDEFQLLANKYL